MHVRLILIITILYIWNIVTLDARFKSKKCYKILRILQDFDFYYNSINLLSSADDNWYQKGREYADQILQSEDYTEKSENASKWKSDIMNHYFYFSSTLEHMNSINVTCQKILINVSVTMMAYTAALNFRVCTLYYSTIYPNAKNKIDTCEELFEYMEWFFSFLFADKVKGFCNMEINRKIGNQRKRKRLIKENVTVDLCGLLSKLNLNFLKKGKNIGHSKFLQDEKADVYNSSLLESFYKNSTNFLQSFYSKNYKNRKIRPEIYDIIWKQILEVHTNNFGNLMRHLNSVIYGGGRLAKTIDVDVLKPSYNFSVAMWSRIQLFKEIKNFPSNALRQTYSKHGDEMLRSNAVDILRLITIIQFQESVLSSNKNTVDKEKNTDEKLGSLLEQTGSNEPVHTCSTITEKYMEKHGFFHYLTIAKSTEKLFH